MPKTQYRPKAKSPTEGMSNSTKTTPFVGTNKASTSEDKLVLVDDDGKPLEKVDYLVNSNSDDKEQWRDTSVDDEYDLYDDDMYEGQVAKEGGEKWKSMADENLENPSKVANETSKEGKSNDVINDDESLL
ncbi:hypothetical protein Tco_0857958 [Tanacetum coccineum]|uniref:Uncharacterized protein n=1 Tax=Tanacetum coccineum TaxID=301880 RepID=A0ABQ5B8K7_9ASTR